MKRRALSFIIVLALCLNLFPAEAFASDVRTGGGLCPHHPAHTDACGYAPPVLGRECTHNHDDGCYTTEINCAHEHTAECYPDSGDASGTEGPSLCAHTCTQDSGCVIQTLSCPHEHDDTCGYVTGNPGARCTFACSICPIDALIGELPSSVSARNAEQVQAQLSEIYALYEELTVDEQQQVDMSPCAALLEQVDGMGSEILSDSSDPAFVLTENTSYNSSLVARIPITLETNGHTLTVQNGNAIQVTGDGKLDIAGGGSVISENGSGVEVQSGGSLSIVAPGTSIQGYIYGLDIASGAAVQLSAGTYFGYYGAIRTADGDFRTLLAPGCAYFDENGQQVLPENVVNIKRKWLTVSQCASHSKTYAHDIGAPTHSWTCDYCGTKETEKCTFSFVQDGDGASTCTDCGNGLTIAVNESDLSNLVYDGTLKPEQVGVTVTLTSPNGVSTTLTKGTDFSVDIEKITDAGQAKVTVTGITFNGTFVKTYTVKQDKPGIKWEGSTYIVDYDGSAVTAGELPNIIITIKSDEDLHPYLRYAYKGTGDADFTGGLPTNAGTYKVKAYLEESQNYEAAETDPLLTLTINRINPITEEPRATTPTYNRTPQELVTAGTLGPVALADGLKIQFSTEENGTYSTDIPTETNAGDYTVWYQVTGLTGNYIAPNSNPAQVLNVKIQRKAITPVVTLSQYSYLYDGGEKQPTVTVTDNEDGHYVINPLDNEYKVEYVNNQNVSTDANPAKVIVADSDANGGNYDITKVEVKFTITSKTQDTLSITQKPNTVTYGDQFTLSTTGGSDSGLVTWEITNGKGAVAMVGPNSGQVTVVGDGTATVKATKSGGNNYEDATDTWTFTAVKKPVTARVTAEDKTYDGNATATVKAVVESGDLAFSGDSITISGLTGTYDNANVGTGKTVTLTGGTVDETASTNADKYDVSIPATATGAILAIPATCTAPNAVASLTYDAAQSQELVTAGTATGGTMVYSLDGNEFSPNIPKAKDAGKYTVYYKARGDQNHTDSEVKTKDVTIGKQTVTPQIELSPPSGQYDGKVQQPAVTVRDGANNVIPESEYKVTYVTDGGKNWKDQGTYTVKVENITGGNYVVETKTADFVISTSAQAPLEIVNKPGLVYYGDTFTLSATGGSSSQAVTWSVDNTSVVEIDDNGFVTIKGTGPATITATKAGGGNYDAATAIYPLNALKKPVTAIVTAENKVYDGNTNATIHVTWNGLVGRDSIDTKDLAGAFENANVGTNKTVTITGTPTSDATSQKYDFTIPGTTTASITKAVAKLPEGLAVATLEAYNRNAQQLVTGGNANTLYSTIRDGVYSATVPTGTNAGTYTVWCKQQGDDNHTDSEPKAFTVVISPKTLTVDASNVELSGNDLQTDTDGTCYYAYDGTEKTPTVTIKDGDAVIPTGEYTVTYSDNKNVTNAGKMATVTITDNEGGNYEISVNGTVSFEIRAGGAQLTKSPEARNLTYTGTAQELVTVGTATGGHIEYKLTSAPTGEPAPDSNFSTSIPKGTKAGAYTVEYQVVGDDNHTDGPSGSVTVTIQPKTVISPKITVNPADDGKPFTYTGNAIEPTVTIVDGAATIPDTEYTLSYQNNTNAGTATVIVTDNNGGNYTVNGTATFEIGKAAAAVGTDPTGKTGLKYNGTAQELITAGSSSDGTMVYSLSETGQYSAAIPTGKAVGEYEIWYKVLGDANHSDSAVTKLTDKVEIEKNTVDNPLIQVMPESVTYNGKKQEPTVTVKADGLLIDGSEYEVTYADTANNGNGDLIQPGTYTVTVTGKGTNYFFTKTAEFTILPANQTPLTITGIKEQVRYGDTIPLATNGGSSGGSVTWSVSDGNIAEITNGVLTVKGVGDVIVTATCKKTGYADQTATWPFHADKKPITAIVTAEDRAYTGDKAATLTVTWKPGDLIGSDSIDTTTTPLTGAFTDANVGTDKTVKIAGTLTHEKYDITVPATTTASITPKPASVTSGSVTGRNLTYNGSAQALIDASGVTVEGGNLMYSLDGREYSYIIPTGTDAKTYTVWYKVEASDENHKDSAAVKLGDVTIAQNVDTPKVRCNPSSFPYDGTGKTPTVVVLDSTEQRIIPDSEYTVTFAPSPLIAVGKYAVIVTDKRPGAGNYEFNRVTVADAFEIVASSQAPLSITDKPAHVYYGDSFYLSATGGSGSGAVKWSIAESGVATISDDGAVTVNNTGSFTVKAYRAASGGYSDSNTDSVTFVAQPKPVTPVVTAADKSYDGSTTATLTASVRPSDLVNSTDNVTLTVQGMFASVDAGVGKRVDLTGHNVGGNDAAKYTINWPDSVTATINRVDAKISGVPTGRTLTYTGSEQQLVSAGTASIGEVVYSLGDQNGPYSTGIPTATAVDTYTVWYKVADSVNYNGVPAASVKAEIKAVVADTPAEGTGSTSPVTPAEDTNNTPTLPVSTPLQTTVRDGTANTVLSASGGNQLVKEAVKNQSDTIVIKPEITSDVSKTQVSIPASTVSQIQSETNAALTVSTPIADATIPREALNTLSQTGGTVNVVTEQVGDAVALTLTADGKTVEDVPGGVTLTVPAEDAGPGTVAVLVQEDGSREIVQRSVVKDGKLSAPLSGSATVEIVDNSKTFADVQPTDWAAEAVTFASARELFSGTSETTFSPEETTSRAMVATVLYRLEGQPDQALTDEYSDVNEDAWYADSVAWAAENGIVNGYGDGKFGPNDSVTREQFVVMLWRYVGSPEANNRDLAAFTDADQINSYALEALCWAVENGVLNGNGSGKLVPGGTATRAEAAQMLKNFIENT